MSKKVYIRTDKNGTKIYHDYTCPRCGGLGGSDKWAFTGWTCYECGGTGESAKPEIIKEYTPEYRAKLDAQRAKRAEKARAKRVEEFKANISKHWQAKGFSEDGKLYVAIGNTYEIKDQLREAGGKWNNYPLSSWIFTEDPKEFDTVELTAEECLAFHYEDGWLDWSPDVNFKELIQSKLPKDDAVVSEYIGEIGDRMDMEVTLSRVISYERSSYGGWGTEMARIYKFTDINGNILIWNTTAWLEIEEGKQCQLTGTVAEHKEYAGDKQTMLKRCKVKEVVSCE